MTRSVIDGRNVWVHNGFTNDLASPIIYNYVYELYISSHFHGPPCMHMEGLVQLVVRLLLQRVWTSYKTTDTLIKHGLIKALIAFLLLLEARLQV